MSKLLNVLIVDDDEEILISLKYFLERNGYVVDTSNTAQDALNKIHNTTFDAILSDIKMPNMDGLELLREVKDTNIPLILMTAYGSSELAIEAMKRGA